MFLFLTHVWTWCLETLNILQSFIKPIFRKWKDDATPPNLPRKDSAAKR